MSAPAPCPPAGVAPAMETNALPRELAGAPPGEPARLLYELVSIPSVSGGEAQAVGHLTRVLAGLGLEASTDGAGNAVGRLQAEPNPDPGPGALHVMLLGHIDTVPGGPRPALRDGAIYGRGAVDAKGPLAVFTAVAGRLARRPEPGLRLTVVGAVEEEVSSSKGARFIAARQRPDVCVIGEPSAAAAVTLGYKGRLLVDLERRRPSSHSAGPEPTATAEIVEAWQRVETLAGELNEGQDRLFSRLQTELQSITTGPRGGDVDACRATFGFRLPPSLPPAELESRLEEVLPGFAPSFRGGEPAWLCDRQSDLVHAFTGAVREVAGERPRLKYKTGTSDMNVVGPAWRIPMLAYGPGDSRLDHTPNEHVDIDEVRLGADVLERALRRLAEAHRRKR